MVPSQATEAGNAAELSFTFVEWLVAPLLVLEESVKREKMYQYTVGMERMGAALDCALAKLKGDSPRAPAVLRAQLRCAAERDRELRGDQATEYVVQNGDLYEVATGFPSGNGTTAAERPSGGPS